MSKTIYTIIVITLLSANVLVSAASTNRLDPNSPYALVLSEEEFAPISAIVKQTNVSDANNAILDFNCDGKADAAFGAPRKSVSGKEQAGAVSIVYGSASGLVKKNNQFVTLDLSVGANANDLFGSAIVGADLDHDGCSDLIVSAPGADNGNNADVGAIWIFWGSHTGIQKANSVTLQGEQSGDLYGSAIAAGDFNGDGNLDLAGSAVGANVNGKSDAGRVYVDYAPSFNHNSRQIWSLNSRGVKGVAHADDLFGSRLYSIDINANGFDDLAIGSPFGNSGGKKGGGFVNILFGSAGGLRAKGSQLLRLKQPSQNDFLGFQITGGYLDNNNFAEIVITAPGLNGGSGGAYVLFGTQSGASLSDVRFLTDPPAKSGESFGFSAVAVDAGDQVLLLFGAPGTDANSITNAGFVYALPWDKSANDFGQDFGFPSPLSGNDFAFGSTLGFTADAKGKPSIIVGEPGAKVVGKENAGDAWNLTVNISSGTAQQLRHLSLGNLKGAPAKDDFWASVAGIARYSTP